MLTNEEIRKNFKNNFDLANHAIKIARNLVLTGKPFTLKAIMEELKKQTDPKVSSI